MAKLLFAIFAQLNQVTMCIQWTFPMDTYMTRKIENNQRNKCKIKVSQNNLQ